MTPVLTGRLQTRLFLSGTVGAVWTAAVTPVLPTPAGTAIAMAYRVTFENLGLMAVLGLGWELVYHLAQQIRWDKDWPTLLALVTVVNEAIALWFVAHALSIIPGPVGIGSPFLPMFAVHVGTTWLLMWLFLQGPIRVLHLRWRFEGGRVLVPAPGRHERRDDWLDTQWLAELRSARLPSDPPPASSDTATVVGMRFGADTTAPLVQGVLCVNGHFGNADARYCAVCGAATPPSATPSVWGPRPPLGVLILADGDTRVLDEDLAVTESAEGLEFHPLDEPTAAQPVARIRLIGWQPVVSSPVRPISVLLAAGGKLRAASDVPVPLEPGAVVLLGEHTIRYDSPYVVEPEATATTDREKGAPVARVRWPLSPETKRTAAAVAAVITLAGAATFGILSGTTPASDRRVTALPPPVGDLTTTPLLPSFSVPPFTLPSLTAHPTTGLLPILLPGPPTGPVLRLPSFTFPPPSGTTTPPVGPPPTTGPTTTTPPTSPTSPLPTPLPTTDLCNTNLLGMLQCTMGGLG